MLEVKGEKKKFNKGIKFLKDQNVKIQPLSEDIVLLEEKCTHCGLCTSVCPSGALSINRKTMEVIYEPEMCVACLECIYVCPLRAIESNV